MNKGLETLISAIIAGLVMPAESYAYIDPGSGSYVIQVLIGLLMGALYAVKIYWSRLSGALRQFLEKIGNAQK